MTPLLSDDLVRALPRALAGGEPVFALPSDAVDRADCLERVESGRDPLAPGTVFVVTTSGSTGTPRAVMLSRAAIEASVRATHERLGGAGDWVLALPAHTVAGTMVIARATLANSQLITVRRDLTDLAATLPQLATRRFISLVPTQLGRALREPDITAALTTFTAVLLGGSAVDPDLLRAAREQRVTVVRTYGMTETCGGCVYDGVPLSGTRIKLDDDRILIESESLFSGYWGDPAATAAALVDGRLRTADRGHWDGATLTVLGRADDVVITAGHNVDLATVEREVARWAATFGGSGTAVGVPDPDLGTRIVAAADVPGELDDLREFAAMRLPRHALPRRLVRLDHLPLLAGGKLDRESIREAVR